MNLTINNPFAGASFQATEGSLTINGNYRIATSDHSVKQFDFSGAIDENDFSGSIDNSGRVNIYNVPAASAASVISLASAAYAQIKEDNSAQ